MARLRFQHLLLLLVCISLSLFAYTHRTIPPPPANSLSFCPLTTSRKHVPTVILQASGRSDRNDNRTFWVAGEGKSAVPMLSYSYPSREMRFAQRTAEGGSASWNDHAGRGHLTGGVDDKEEEGKQLCPVFAVPSSPPPSVPSTWKDNSVMFGMSTSPDRVLNNLPVWSHWIPSSPSPLDPSSPATADLPIIFILTPLPNPTEAARTREAMEEAQSLGLFLKMRATEADRFETRYFSLVQEMWLEAQSREESTGIVTEWFVFADDDTFFPDFKSLIRMLSSYDAGQDRLIGALSESTKQVAEWGHIAYGGAGIYVSRSLVAKMNANGAWSGCLQKFGSAFGGDAMISQCAASVLDSTVQDVLTLDSTLHQLDIRGDSTGWFQSGFLITSLHHWGSWFSIFPSWVESGTGDSRKGIILLGKAGKHLGGDNFGRRYVFDEGKVVVHLGYSVVITLKPVTEEQLGQSEHTWSEFVTYHPIRPLLQEGTEKRTYYLTAVRPVGSSGVVRLEHKDQEGERVDVIVDGRAGLIPVSRSRWGRGFGRE